MGKAQKEGKKDEFSRMACEKWLDVRSFGQVFAFSKGKKKDEELDAGGISVGVRGPVSIHPAFSVDAVTPVSIQITKSVNSETDAKNPDKKSSDTMGMKHRIDFGLYVLKGSVNVQLAEKTGFSEEDAEKLKKALLTLFVNDASSARPDGYTLYTGGSTTAQSASIPRQKSMAALRSGERTASRRRLPLGIMRSCRMSCLGWKWRS